jgi:hypothetical protein
MASAASATPTVPPPPGGPMPAPPKSGADASPAPAEPQPQVEQGSRLVIQTVQALRQLAKMYPAAAPAISKINDAMREVQLKVMAGSKPSEPAAPPVPPS